MKQHTEYADLDEMVFEGRHKDYGAYKMRTRYNRILTRSALIACLSFVAVTGLPKVIDWITPDQPPGIPVVEFTSPNPVNLLPPPKVIEEEFEPPKPPTVKKVGPRPAPKTIAFSIIEPSDNELVDTATIESVETVLNIDSAAIGFTNIEGHAYSNDDDIWSAIDLQGDPCPECEITAKKAEEDPKHDDLNFVEEEPRPVNMDELRKLIGYPTQAAEAGIKGKVVVRVLVDKTGKYQRHVVYKDPHPILTRAVESKLDRLVFTPGIQNKQPVKVWVTIPFDFQLLGQ